MKGVSKKNLLKVFLVIIAIVLFLAMIMAGVFVFFSPSPADGPSAAYQTCISAPSSEGCEACQLGGEYIDWEPKDPSIDGILPPKTIEASELCKLCEDEYLEVAVGDRDEVSERCRDPE